MKYFVLCMLLLSGLAGAAQNDSSLPYKRFPTLPPLKALLPDSVHFYTKDEIPPKTPVLYMLFDPGCSHCQHETEDLVAHKDDLADIQVVMVTMPQITFAQIAEFRQKYKLDQLHHLVMGKDIFYFMPSFYMVHNFPLLALYNREGRLITASEGTVSVDTVIAYFKAAH